MTTDDEKKSGGVTRIQFDCDSDLHAEICEFRHEARHRAMRGALEALLRAGLEALRPVRTGSHT